MADEAQMAALVAAPKATLTVRNASELTLRFEGHPHYSIWVPETLTIELPASAILTNNSIVAAPTIILWATPGELVFQGPLVANGQESTMALADTTLTLRLVDDMWMPAVGRIACDRCPAPLGLDHTRDRYGDVDGDGLLDTIDDDISTEGCPCVEGDANAHYTPDGRNASMALLEELISQREGVGSGQPSGWNNIVRRVLLESGYFEPRLWRVDDQTLNVTIPQQLRYDIDIPETVSLNVPRSALLSDRSLDVTPTLVIMPTAGKASINGSLLYGVTEVTMRDASRPPLELLVRLQNDSWVESLGQGNNAATRAFAFGITAAGDNLNECLEYSTADADGAGGGVCVTGGWMHVVQPLLTSADGYLRIARLSETLVKVSLDGVPGYDIRAPDLINVYVPREAVLSDQLIVSPTQIRIDATRGNAYIAGGALRWANRERTIQSSAASATLELFLEADTWMADLGGSGAMATTKDLLAGLISDGDEPTGWNAIVAPALQDNCRLRPDERNLGALVFVCDALTRVSDTILLIDIPHLPLYDITMPEVISLTVPRAAVLSDLGIDGSNTLRIRATPGKAELSGSLVASTRSGCVDGVCGFPEPMREAELRMGETAKLRNVSYTYEQFGNDTRLTVNQVAESADLTVEVQLHNDTWVLQTDTASGTLYMADALKLQLVSALSADLAECTGWDASSERHRIEMVGGVQVVSETRLTITLPAMPGYDIRVPETVTLVLPGATVASDERIDQSPDGQPNAFALLPDAVAADSLEVFELRNGGEATGAMPYYTEVWYKLETPADAGVVIEVDAAWNESLQLYGAVHMQVYEDRTLVLSDYQDCRNNAATGCGAGGDAGVRKDCRCIRDDLANGRPPWQYGMSTQLLERPAVVYETASLGWQRAAPVRGASRRSSSCGSACAASSTSAAPLRVRGPAGTRCASRHCRSSSSRATSRARRRSRRATGTTFS